jgi:phage N-6-adenine-methyltransferase
MSEALAISEIFSGMAEPVEQWRLSQWEAFMERCDWAKAYALREIRDKRLYLETHFTWEAYCNEKHNRSATHINRQIAAIPSVEILTPMGVKISTERHVREVASLPPAYQVQVLNLANETAPNGKLTAAHIRETRESFENCQTMDDVDEVFRGKPHVVHNSGDNEWYTPREYVDAAFEVMGRIDLDPASSATANEVVDATVFYTLEDDGLIKEWQGRVWMNPPYAGELIGKFATKLCQHFNTGEVTEAIVLVNNATETRWFQEMASVASAMCIPKGRVRFWHPRKEAVPLQGQAVLYLGPNLSRFKSAFSSFGEAWGKL